MPFNDVYRRQVELLIRTLPYVAEEECFALKGGTAINLFVRDLPRLSVDIDLTYLPVAGRDHSLAKIDNALIRIGARIKSVMKGITITESAPATQQTINKLILRTSDRVQIKIEVTNDDMRTALIVYLISHDHSPHSLLSPAARDIAHDYEQNFLGMTEEDVAMKTLLATRTALVDNIASNMSEDHRHFLVSFYRRKPEWSLLGLDGLDQLPAVRWRELNLDRAGEETRSDMVRKLEEVFC